MYKKNTTHKKKKNVFAFGCVLAIVIMYILLVVSCNKNTVQANKSLDAVKFSIAINTSIGNEVVPSSVFSRLMSWKYKIMDSMNTNTEDMVLVSDPFYATHFISGGRQGFSGFYKTALESQKSAKIFVILEPQDSAVHRINIDELVPQFPVLSALDFATIKYAKKVVFSPLLEILAPNQYQAIVEMREKSGRKYATIAYDEPTLSDKLLTVNYNGAMKELGTLGAKIAMQRDSNSPYIYLFLASNNAKERSARAELFLKNVYQYNPNITVNTRWLPDKEASTANLLKKFSQIPQNAIIVLDVGEEGYSAVLDYINTHTRSEERWKDRFLVVSYFWPEQFKYNIPVYAKVFVPENFLFQNIHNISAVLSRISR